MMPFKPQQWFDQANAVIRFSEEMIQPFRQAIRLICSNPTLVEWAEQSSSELFSMPIEKSNDGLWTDTSKLEQHMGEYAGMFAAVVLLSGLPNMIEIYNARNIPLDVLAETMSDIEVWIRDYRNKHGKWGLANVRWMRYHMAGKLLRLGRLQFMRERFYYAIHVFRHMATGEVTALSSAGVRYRTDGQVDGTNDICDLESWTACYEDNDKEFVGHPLLPAGVFHRETVRLSKTEWQEVLKEGDSVLAIHIAEGSKMTLTQCLESYRLALEFFPIYFPEEPFAAFVCGSWLLTPQFQQILPEASNIVQFQKDFQLFPIHSHDASALKRVFGEQQIDPATAPRHTTLQKAILDFMAAGHRLHSGAGFILREDMQRRVRASDNR